MGEYEKLTDLVGDIHDTALNSAQWPNVIAKITDFVGGQAGGLILKDPVSRYGKIDYHYNVDPHYLQLYAKTYSQISPLAILPPTGKIVSIPDLVPYDECRRGRFYHEWMRPQGWTDYANVVLEKTGPNQVVVLSICPTTADGMVDKAMRQRLALVVPHARRALLIAKAMEFKQSQQMALTDMLDALSAGIFLVDASGRIVHANNAGQNMLYANDFLRSSNGQLTASDARLNQIILKVLTACANGDAGIGASLVALPLIAHDGERYMAHVLPLTSGTRCGIGTAYGATAAMFVRKVALEIQSIPESVCEIYRLTQTEQRVLSSIVQVGGVSETAQTLGIAVTTVKTHLHNVFAKIGVNRQADLVKLVAGFSNPLLTSPTPVAHRTTGNRSELTTDSRRRR